MTGGTWDQICEELIAACDQIPYDTREKPDEIHNRLVKRLQMAAAQYRLARDRLPYPTEEP